MFEPDNMKHIKRLREAMRHSRRRLSSFRRHRNEAIKQFAGFHYGDTGDAAETNVPVNLLEMAVMIYGMQLAAQRPRVLVSTPHKSLKADAATLELVTNQAIEQVGLGSQLWDVVQDALFCIGILKLGLEVDEDGVTGPFCEPVSLDDWVHDVAALRWEQVSFAGNRYRLPYEEVMDSPLYGRKAKKELKPSERETTNEEGEDKSESISRGSDVQPDEYLEYVDLWDVWLPRERLVVTFSEDFDREPLRTVEWDGPDAGPYHLLTFQTVPDQIMPLSIAAMSMDLHTLVNDLYRKTAEQAQRQKDITAYEGSAAEDAGRIQRAADGAMIRLDNLNATREISFGGPDPSTIAFAIGAKDLFSWTLGNLDALGGLSAQAETATQDTMLERNASKRIAFMQQRTVEYAERVVRSLMWYEWTDPVRQKLVKKAVPGSEIEVDVIWSPETRRGEFLDYNFRIEPYSMTYKSPAQKLATLTQVWQTFIMPYMQFLQMQGIGVDFQQFLELLAKYADMTEIKDVLTFFGEMPESSAAQSPAPTGSAYTHRVNERVNTPGTTRQGNDQILQQIMLGSRLQEPQRRAISGAA